MMTLYDAGGVIRLHTVPTLRTHSIAEHVYGAQCVAIELCKLNDISSSVVLRGLLYHDAPEVYTGDVPAPTKRISAEIDVALTGMEDEFCSFHGIPNVSRNWFGDREWAVFKSSDYLDLAFTCLQERVMGNLHPRLTTVMNNVTSYLDEHTKECSGVADLLANIRREWSMYGE